MVYIFIQWHPTPVLLPGKSHGWRSLVGCSNRGVAKSQARLSDFTFTFHFHAWEKEMATHSNVFAWRIPGSGEPGIPQFIDDINGADHSAAFLQNQNGFQIILRGFLDHHSPRLLPCSRGFFPMITKLRCLCKSFTSDRTVPRRP